MLGEIKRNYCVLLALIIAIAMVIPGTITIASELGNIESENVVEDYYQITFAELPSESARSELSAAYDISFLDYIQDNSYMIRIPTIRASQLAAIPLISSITQYAPALKISPDLKGVSGDIKLRINIHDGEDVNVVASQLTSMGVTVTRKNSELVNYIECHGEARNIEAISSIKAINSIQPDGEKETHMSLITSNTYIGVDAAQAGGFRGSGMLAEVQDNGIDRLHPDLTSVTYTDGTVVADSHGTCTSGIVFGTGAGDINAQGIAYQATGVFADWNTGRTTSVTNLWNGDFNEGMVGLNGVVQSNSWSQGTLDGTYTTYSNEDDVVAVNFPKVLTLWAAGNANSGTGIGLITQDSANKNGLCIGAIFHKNTAVMTDDDYHDAGAGMTPSRGLAADGRMKPDLIAAFDWIYTVDQRAAAGYTSTNYYDDFGGTSGATPTVAGCAVQTYEMYQENFFDNNPTNAIPYSATIKALMIADAYQYPIGTNAITRNVEGWGAPDMENTYNLGAAYHVINESPQALSSGNIWSRTVYSDGTKPLKISTVWTDPAAPSTTGTGRALINNLDLRVVSPGGTVYWGNMGLMSNIWSVSGTGTNDWTRTAPTYTDDENNVENVFIQNPAAGLWTIEVQGATGDVAQGPQHFSMVASGAMGISAIGTIALDKTEYQLPDTVEVTVQDLDLNINPAAINTVNVNVKSTLEPAGETLLLTETGVDTSTFVNTIPISSTNSAGVLWAAHGNLITATYNDADAGGAGPAVVTDTATVDGQVAGPTGLTVEWSGIGSMNVFTDDVEGGNLGYTLGSTVENFAIRALGSHSATRSWDFGNGNYQDVAGGSNSWLITPNIVIPPGAISATLSFWHWYDFEGTNWDGGNVKISTTGAGGTFNIITPTPGYTATLATGYENPMAGEQVWSGAGGWLQVTADLTSYIGQTVNIQWDVGCDNYATTDVGWRIDDIVVSVVGSGVNADNLLNWALSTDDGGGQNDVVGYNIYRANNAGGPWDAGALINTIAAGLDTYTDPTRGEFDGINWYYVVRAVDDAGNIDTNTNAVPEEVVGGTTATATGPIGGPTNVAAITLTYSWTGTPTSVNLYYTKNGGTSWTLAINDATVDGSRTYTIAAGSGTYGWLASAVGGGSTEPSPPAPGTPPEAISYILDITVPAAPTGLTVEHYGLSSGMAIVEGFQPSNGGLTASTNLVLNAPTGITAGELLLLIVGNADNTATAQFSNNLAGWNFIGTSGSATPDAHIGAFWRIATGTEGQVTVVSQSSDFWMGWYIRISGADTITPINVFNFALSAGNLASHIIPQVTTTADDCLAIYGLAFDGGDGLPFTVTGTGWSETDEQQSDAAATHVSGAWGTKIQAIAGGTGTATVACTVSDGASYFQLAINSASGGGTLDDNTLNWTHSGVDVDHYNIYRDLDGTGATYALLDTVPVGTNTYCDIAKGQADSTLWWYRVRAVDAASNEETNVNGVQEPAMAAPYSIDLTGKSPNSWVFVSFPSAMSGAIQTILDDSVAGDGLTTWTVAKWLNIQDISDPWKTYRPGYSNDIPTMTNQMGVWLWITENGGDQKLTLNSYAANPVGNVLINLYEGWNMVGYPSATSRAESATLPAQADYVANWQAATPFITQHAKGATLMAAGNAYWIHVTADCVWTVQP